MTLLRCLLTNTVPNAATTRRDQPTVYRDSTSRGLPPTQAQAGRSLNPYDLPLVDTTESSRAAGQQPARGSSPAAERHHPNFCGLIAVDYGSMPTFGYESRSNFPYGGPSNPFQPASGSYNERGSNLASSQSAISNSKARLDPSKASRTSDKITVC